MSGPRSIGLVDVLDALEARLRQGLRVALPGKVLTYDAAQQRADVQPLLREERPSPEDGSAVVYSLPVCRNVPVLALGNDEWFVHVPLQKGDTVELVFQDRSLDRWKSLGGEVDPVDVRRHHLSDAVAIPGLRAFNAPLSGMRTDALTLGRVGGLQIQVTASAVLLGGADATKSVARAEEVASAFSSLTGALASAVDFNAFKAAVAALAGFPGALASSVVKVKA